MRWSPARACERGGDRGKGNLMASGLNNRELTGETTEQAAFWLININRQININDGHPADQDFGTKYLFSFLLSLF